MENQKSSLRRRAEEFLNRNHRASKKVSSREVQDLIEDLHIHQIELELQNEELRHAQLELEKARSRYSDLYDFAPVGYFTISENGVILETNLTGATMLGVERRLLIDKHFFRFIASDSQDVFYNHRKILLETKNRQSCELKLIAQGGAEFHAQLVSIVVDDAEGNVSRIRTTVSDISERKRAEEEKVKLEAKIRQAQKMEALGTLAGGIAHDFNNLLMAIQGNVDLVLFDKDSGHPDYESLRYIQQHVQSCAKLTKQLLGISRTGKYEVKPENLNEIIKKTSDLFGRTKKEITILFNRQKDIWPVEVDQSQIEQALLNLLINAWYAMPEGGYIHLQTENVELDEHDIKPYPFEPGNYVKMSVTDTGVGMDSATQQRIFDPFFTTRELNRGTGLGLASAYGIVKNHGGNIDVYSEKGKGATFTIYLPATDKAFAKEKKKPLGEIQIGTETILMVDDEDMVLNVGKLLLENLGYRVLIAKSGREAIDIYQKNNNEIDLVILDMIMPGMGGAETFDALVEVNPDIKVLLASGYSIDNRASNTLKSGCSGFIHKPYDITELSKKLREILEEK
jgi:PAS domain S-box-containing protein